MLNQADRRELEGNIGAISALTRALEDANSDCIMITPDGRWMTQTQVGTKAHTSSLDEDALARLNDHLLTLALTTPAALFNSEWELSTLQGARGATLVFERTRRPRTDIESQRVRHLLTQSIARGDNGVLIGQNDTQLFDALGWIASQLDTAQVALVSTRRLPDELASRVVQFDPPSTPSQRARLIRLLQRMDAVLIDEARDADTVQLALGYPGARNRWMMLSAASPRAGLEALQKRTRDIPARDLSALVFMADLNSPGRITHLIRRTSGSWDEATEQGTSLLPLIDIYIPSARARPDHDLRATLEAQEFTPEIIGELPQESNPDLYLAAHDLHGLHNSEELDAIEQQADAPTELAPESDPDATIDSLSIDYINALDDSSMTGPEVSTLSDDELVAPGLQDYEDPDEDSPLIDVLDASPATQEFYVAEHEDEDDDPIIVDSRPDDLPESLPEEPWTKTQEYENRASDASRSDEAIAARIDEHTFADFSVDQHMEAIRDSAPAEEVNQYAELKRIEQQLRAPEPHDEPTIIHDDPILTDPDEDAITSNVSDDELSEVLAVLSEIENEEGLELSEAHLLKVDEIASEELDVDLDDLYEPHDAGMTTNEYDRPRPAQNNAPTPPEAPAGLTPPVETDEPTQVTDFALESSVGAMASETPALTWGDDEQTATHTRAIGPDESSSEHQQHEPPPSSSTSVKLNALSQRLKALRQRRQQLSGQPQPTTPAEEPPSDSSGNLLQALRKQRQQDP